MRGKSEIVSPEEAIAEIPDGATVAVSGFVGAGHPEAITSALEQQFLLQGKPSGLTLVYAAGQGDKGSRGLNHLGHAGLIRKVIGGHWNLAPKLGQLALEGRIEAYNLPQGVLCVLFREIAAGRPGIITKVGLNTFIDPDNGGGSLNSLSCKPPVERLKLHGETYLFYRSFPINVALIRATRADRKGNLSMEREALVGECLPLAQAAKNHGGIVIAQVEEVVDSIEDPKSVRIPGILVDYIVPANKEQHLQTFAEAFNPDYVRRSGRAPSFAPLPFSERRVVGRRALLEVAPGMIVNLGIGFPEAVAAAAAEENRLDEFTLTVESGPIGGIPASGLSFGCSTHPEAVVDQPSQFDFYDGGGLDLAILGAAEVDGKGNVCVSQMGGRFAGVGGFVNIATNAKKLIFCCAFRPGGLRVSWQDNQLCIDQEGTHNKFVSQVSQICFHGPGAAAEDREVLYVTERAVFQLEKSGLRLLEVAPGIDPDREILAHLPFPILPSQPKTMPAFCFQ
jgi:propionate CoA-transferase